MRARQPTPTRREEVAALVAAGSSNLDAEIAVERSRARAKMVKLLAERKRRTARVEAAAVVIIRTEHAGVWDSAIEQVLAQEEAGKQRTSRAPVPEETESVAATGSDVEHDGDDDARGDLVGGSPPA